MLVKNETLATRAPCFSVSSLVTERDSYAVQNRFIATVVSLLDSR